MTKDAEMPSEVLLAMLALRAEADDLGLTMTELHEEMLNPSPGSPVDREGILAGLQSALERSRVEVAQILAML